MTSSPSFQRACVSRFRPAAIWSRSRPIIHRAVTAMLIPDPTDNLILHSILDHAGRFPGATKALLTDNTKDFDTEDVQAALAAAGINRPFRSVTNVLGWLGSLPH